VLDMTQEPSSIKLDTKVTTSNIDGGWKCEKYRSLAHFQPPSIFEVVIFVSSLIELGSWVMSNTSDASGHLHNVFEGGDTTSAS